MDFIKFIIFIIIFLLVRYVKSNKKSEQEKEQDREIEFNTMQVRAEQEIARRLEIAKREKKEWVSVAQKKPVEKKPILPPARPASFPHQKAVSSRFMSIPSRHMEQEEELEPSRADKILREIKNRRDLIVYQEIMNKPKSMRPPL